MTQDSEEWTDWQDHTGGPCPVPTHFLVEIRLRKGLPETRPPVDLASRWVWPWGGGDMATDVGDIIRYRIRKPRALRDLITLVETLPAPQRHTQEADG